MAAGGFAIDPSIIATLLDKRRTDDPLASLTPRERQVLELMAEGRSNQGIADKLVITLRAAEKYVSNVFDKLELPSGAQRFTTGARRTCLPALLTGLGTSNPSPGPHVGRLTATEAGVRR